jgi:hypothetical protein
LDEPPTSGSSNEPTKPLGWRFMFAYNARLTSRLVHPETERQKFTGKLLKEITYIE